MKQKKSMLLNTKFTLNNTSTHNQTSISYCFQTMRQTILCSQHCNAWTLVQITTQIQTVALHPGTDYTNILCSLMLCDGNDRVS